MKNHVPKRSRSVRRQTKLQFVSSQFNAIIQKKSGLAARKCDRPLAGNFDFTEHRAHDIIGSQAFHFTFGTQ